jgi:AraC-like DNA-binding protein
MATVTRDSMDPASPASAASTALTIIACWSEPIPAPFARLLANGVLPSPCPHADEAHASCEQRCVQRTLAYIHEHLWATISLSELSNIFGASRCRFTAKFKQHTGYTPHAYILHRKIMRAREALTQTDKPILEIALDLGFNSQPHFTSAFRKEMGLPPARWRQENR